jgi:hypothetical protein
MSIRMMVIEDFRMFTKQRWEITSEGVRFR